MKKTKKGEKPMDLKPLIYGAEMCMAPVEACVKAGQAAYLKLSAGSAANIKPELILAAFYEFIGEEYPVFGFQIHRNEIYGGEAGAFLPLEAYGEDIG